MHVKGVKKGYIKKWYKNGTLNYEGYYLKGKKAGIWKIWDKNGELRKYIFWKNKKISAYNI